MSAQASSTKSGNLTAPVPVTVEVSVPVGEVAVVITVAEPTVQMLVIFHAIYKLLTYHQNQ